MGEGICLQCLKTKDYYYVDDDFITYIKKLLSKLDIENQFEDFLVDDLGFCDCIDLSWLLRNHIDENKIFEMVDKHNDPIPVVIDANSTIPEFCRPLPMDKLNQFGELINFLGNAFDGVTIG